MNKDHELIRIDDPKSLGEFLQQPAIKLGEFITGILVSESKDWKLSAGHLVQASIKWKLFSQLGKEINNYIEKGKIKDNFLNTDQNKQSLSDILKYIDENSPNEDCFEATKSLFFRSVSCESTQDEQIISYQFMQICKQLQSSELLILKAAYDINCGRLSDKLKSIKIDPNDANAQNWLMMISKQVGHEISSLIEVNEDKLVKLKLIGPRIHSDLSGIRTTKKYRLTDLGYKLCEYIYESNF